LSYHSIEILVISKNHFLNEDEENYTVPLYFVQLYFGVNLDTSFRSSGVELTRQFFGGTLNVEFGPRKEAMSWSAKLFRTHNKPS